MVKRSSGAAGVRPSDARRAGTLGEIVYRDPASLVPYERNSRKHSERQVKQLRAAMDEFGFTQPILLRDDKRIGAGHGRQKAALLEPPLATVPTIIVEGLNDDQWRALIIADNKLALNAEWDTDMLAAELHELQLVADFDVAVIGFTEGEVADLTALPEPGSGGTGSSDGPMTAEQVTHMVNRFLSWKLPQHFGPDAGISFAPMFAEEPMRSRHWPVGTNLLSAEMAEAMVRHMLDGLPE